MQKFAFPKILFMDTNNQFAKNLDVEKLFLKKVLVDYTIFLEAKKLVVSSAYFADPYNKIIYEQMLLSSDKYGIIDTISINLFFETIDNCNEVKDHFLTIIDSVEIVRNWEELADKIVRDYQKRIVGEVINNLTTEVNKPNIDVVKVIKEYINTLTEIVSDKVNSDEFLVQNILEATLKRIKYHDKHTDDDLYIKTGFESLDNILIGFKRKKLYVIGARPSMGKTAFMASLVTNIIRLPQKNNIVIFSLNMDKQDILNRILSCMSEVSLNAINTCALKEFELNRLQTFGADILANHFLYIDDTPILTTQMIRSRLIELNRKNPLSVVFIDYLQLIKPHTGRYKDEQIGQIMQDLRNLAIELNISIVILSQLSRSVENRKDGSRVPQLSDLRDSGAIEQLADVVILMFRLDYYGIDTDEFGETNKGETYIKIAKNNYGVEDVVKLIALLHIQKFIEEDDDRSAYQIDESGEWTKYFEDKRKGMKGFDGLDENPF